MDYSPKQRLAIVAAVVITLATAILMMSCGGNGAADLKTGKQLQMALGSFEAEQGHYPKHLAWEDIEQVLVDENRKPYLNVMTADYTLSYTYHPAGDDIGVAFDSYEAYLLQRNGDDYTVVRITPDKVEATTIESVPTN